jgi:putative membrane protein
MNEELGATLALVNACLNATSAALLIVGRVAIATGRRALHQKLMVSAFSVSTLFLISYLTRVLLTGTHRYPGTGPWRTVYLATLMSHMLLAIITPPLAIAALWLARRGRFEVHRRVVRWAWPIWIYVSVTGVAVYILLYHPPG